MIGLAGDLPECHKEAYSALEKYHGEGDASALPSPQKLASLHRFFARRFAGGAPHNTTDGHRLLLDIGTWGDPGESPSIAGDSALLIRTLSEWIEDTRRLLEDGEGGYIYSRCDNALLASSARLQSHSERVHMMLPILLSTLGNPTADGGHLVMPKQRAESLTVYFLESLDLNSRSIMRFSVLEPEEGAGTEEEQEERRAENALKHSSFPKLLEGFRRMRKAAIEEDGSDLVVDRLLASIDSLIFESLVYYSYKKSLSEIRRKRKAMLLKINEVHLSSDLALPEVLKQELDRLYTSMERSCRNLTPADAEEKSGYNPFLIQNRSADASAEKMRDGRATSFQSSFFKVLDIDRGILAVNRVRSRGLPEVLLLPGNAVASYDRDADALLLPSSVMQERSFDSLANAIASFRWKYDANSKLQNIWAELMEYRGNSPLFELEPSFRQAYSTWIRHAAKGEKPEDEQVALIGEVLEKEGDFARCPL
ncbi:MAG: hypothetical protein QM446_07275 [Synergistota bacterium]|nr:hypothetical protein [Synergistota bacterium]